MGQMLLCPIGRVFSIPLLTLQLIPTTTPTLAQLLDGSGETRDKK